MIEINNTINNDFGLNAYTKIGDSSALLKRARAKYFTFGLMFNMINLDSELKESYWNTYYCASELVQEGNKITSKYCKNRWCLVCNRIRTAVNIKKYSEEIRSWGDERFFITLTIPNVKAEFLRGTIDDMLRNFYLIRRVIQERRGLKFLGIRKLECTYNPERDDYHPHFHCIVKGKEVAEMLQVEWLKRYPEAEEFCQDVRQGDEGSMMELFKYFTKVISSRAGKNKGGNKVSIEFRRKIYVNALDNIFCSIRGRRTFQNFGFKAKNIDEEKIETVEVDKICDKIQYYNWEKELHDWINVDTGELLTGYKPTEAMEKLLNEGIVIDLGIKKCFKEKDKVIIDRFYKTNVILNKKKLMRKDKKPFF